VGDCVPPIVEDSEFVLCCLVVREDDVDILPELDTEPSEIGPQAGGLCVLAFQLATVDESIADDLSY
jgi:hypothetical protein